MYDASGNDFDGVALGVADRFITGLPLTHHAGKFKSVGNPPTVFLSIQINRQVHSFVISCREPMGGRGSQARL